MSEDVMGQLAATIGGRRHANADTSYTRQLLDAGRERCARKFGEESVELVIAALGKDKQAVAAEAADVIYHLMVLVEACDMSWNDVALVLAGRMGTSGVAEKASRPTPGSR